ncbi:gp16 family protein [Candidatus Pantoea persica]|uniref:gp16 family protein n=1 Tax=Candidatus Pantoea persica TaxID=2518128 RepID=UPI00215D73D9|nr:regulatory protein GemA [Candidatus Pantoea persica]MBA2817597.1 Mu-like prophage protein gp16 [Candidatus Pantoea persica]
MTRQKYLQLIHIAAQHLKLDDTTYRQMLHRLTGKTSAKALNIGQLAQVLNALKTQGFRIQPTQPMTKKQTDRPQIQKMQALWQAMAQEGIVQDALAKALAHFVKRETGCDSPYWLDSQQASQVIEKLKQWQKRVVRATSC